MFLEQLHEQINTYSVTLTIDLIDVTGIKTDVTGIKTDITGMETDIAGIITDTTESKEADSQILQDIAGRIHFFKYFIPLIRHFSDSPEKLLNNP